MSRYFIVILFLFSFFTQSLFSEDSKNTRTAKEVTADKRLPPVLPGESVSDGKKSMKVWSTAGPVPVTKLDRDVDSPNFEPPRAPRAPRGRRGVNDLPVNVIVDGR